LRWMSLPLGIVVVLFIVLALLPGPAVFLVVVNRRNRLLQIASQSAANSQPVRRRTEEDDCVLRCTSMHSANPRGGTPIVQAPCGPPSPSAERQSSLLQRKRHCETQIGAKLRSPRKRLTAWKSRIACASIACGCVGAFGPVAPARLLPVKLLPISATICPIHLHRLHKFCPQPGKPNHRRADAGLRELPEYPTAPSRVNAPTAPVVGQFASALKGTGFSPSVGSNYIGDFSPRGNALLPN
jgi:hypothetical protein